MTIRWSALVPVCASTVVVALSIILLASGTTPATANHNFWLSVCLQSSIARENLIEAWKNVADFHMNDQQANVSRIGQSLLWITPTNVSTAALVSSFSLDDSSNSGQDNALQCFLGNLTACLQPPELPTPGLPTPSLPTLSSSDSSATPSPVASALPSAVPSVILNLTQMQPSSDIYNFYVTRICQGKFVDEDNPDSDSVTTRCVSYSDETDGLGQIVNTTSSIPSSILVGSTANISVPPIAAVKQAIATTMPVVASSARVILALVVIRIIAGTLALAGSALLLIDIRRFVVFTMLTFATLANISLLLAAGITTGLVVLQAEIISGLADALSVEVQYGTSFLVLEWVTAVFAIVGSLYWLVIWFVEFRTLTFSRRRRSARQIGNWMGTWSELKQDFRGEYFKL